MSTRRPILPFALGALTGALLLGAVLGALALRDLGSSLVDAGNAVAGAHYQGQTIQRMGQETQMLDALLLGALQGTDRATIAALIDTQGWESFEAGADTTLFARAGMGQIGFVFDDNRLIGLTGECDNLGMPQSCQFDGET